MTRRYGLLSSSCPKSFPLRIAVALGLEAWLMVNIDQTPEAQLVSPDPSGRMWFYQHDPYLWLMTNGDDFALDTWLVMDLKNFYSYNWMQEDILEPSGR